MKAMSRNVFDDITAVFIDLDDTLWWFSANSLVALRMTYDHYCISRYEPDFDIFERIYETRNSELWHEYHHGRIERDYLMVERFRHALEQVGFNGDCTAVGSEMNSYYLDVLARQPLIVPGAKSLLEALHRHGLQVNVLSNGFAGVQQRKLRSGGIDKLIDNVILSDDCGITKPLPGIFHYALQRCHVQARNVVMIGDDPDTDIAGAHQAGWRTIYFNAKQRPAVPGTVTIEVSTLEQIEQLLEETSINYPNV